MARYRGPVERISRRVGVNLFLKGERSQGPKSAVTRRPYPPGQHGPSKRPSKLSEYGKQLREKQKAKAIYGVLEKQFQRYYKQAVASRGNTAERLLQLLELRLDNVVFRLGLADTRRQARQYVTHGHVRIDGKKVSIPSYQVAPMQTIELVHVERKSTENEVPVWIRKTTDMGGELLSLPTRDQIPLELEEQLIIEFYSR